MGEDYHPGQYDDLLIPTEVTEPSQFTATGAVVTAVITFGGAYLLLKTLNLELKWEFPFIGKRESAHVSESASASESSSASESAPANDDIQQSLRTYKNGVEKHELEY